MALIAVVGALIGLAVFAQHKSVPQVSAARTALAGDAAQRTRDVSALEQTSARPTSASWRPCSRRSCSPRPPAASSRSRRQRSRRRWRSTPVSGPGVSVTVTDVAASAAPNAGSRPQGQLSGTGQASDRDLQTVVNALWAAGAQAITVGGVRLGPQTAIRTAGQTILVDFQPLSSPYVISADRGSGLRRRSNAVGRPRGAAAPGRAGTHPDVATRSADALQLPAVTPAAAGTISSARPIAGRSLVIGVAALVAGLVVGLILQPTAPGWLEPYLPIAVVAALDAVFGAVRAGSTASSTTRSSSSRSSRTCWSPR